MCSVAANRAAAMCSFFPCRLPLPGVCVLLFFLVSCNNYYLILLLWIHSWFALIVLCTCCSVPDWPDCFCCWFRSFHRCVFVVYARQTGFGHWQNVNIIESDWNFTMPTFMCMCVCACICGTKEYRSVRVLRKVLISIDGFSMCGSPGWAERWEGRGLFARRLLLAQQEST